MSSEINVTDVTDVTDVPTTTVNDLTKEEYDAIVNTSLIHKEECQLMVVQDKEPALVLWKSLMKKFKGSGIPIRKDLTDTARKWKKKSECCVAMISGVESQNIECIALLSRNNTKHKFFVDYIITMNPVSTQPFIEMLLTNMKKVAQQNGTDIIVPKCYGRFVEDSDIEIMASETINVEV